MHVTPETGRHYISVFQSIRTQFTANVFVCIFMKGVSGDSEQPKQTPEQGSCFTSLKCKLNFNYNELHNMHPTINIVYKN